MMVFFVLSLFPRDVLDEILDLIESVSERVFLPTLFNIDRLYGHLILQEKKHIRQSFS